MVFHSFAYLLFFPIVYIIYFLLPGRVRYLWLLAASCFFYACADIRYLLLLGAIVLLSYGSGILIARVRATGRSVVAKTVLILTVLCNLGILGYFKYTNFLLENLNGVMAMLHSDRQFAPINGLLSLGISFILFQSVSYTADVYRGTIDAERNILKFSLYLAFFPKLISGPIERAGDILPQIHKGTRFSLQNLKEGLCLILLGLFYKLVLSDNIAAIINPIFASYTEYSGLQIALAFILLPFQIYGDFGGYSYIAIGSARALGFRLSDNFEAPFHSESIAEFWRRWHITLNNWFKDYLYIPLGGSRRGFARTCLNTMIVFLLSGLWHGAAWSYVMWGGLNGLFIIAGNLRKRLQSRSFVQIQSDRDSTVFHMRRRLATFVLFDSTLLFFGMPSVQATRDIVIRAVTQPGIRDLFSLGFLDIFPDIPTFALIAAALIVLLWIDTVIYRTKSSFTVFFFRQSSLFRWLFCIVILYMIIFFGAYGETYEQTQFIYFQF